MTFIAVNTDDSLYNLNIDDFLTELQIWNQDVDKLIQCNVGLEELLKEEKHQLKQQQELQQSRDQEINFFKTSVKELQQTIEHLQDVEHSNEKIKSELEVFLSRNVKTAQLHKEELENFKASLEENRAQSKQQIQELRHSFNQDMKIKEEQIQEILSSKDQQLAELHKENAESKKNFKEEILKIQLQNRLQLAKLEEQLVKAQQKPAANQSTANQEIYRNKLHRLQEDYRYKLDSQQREIESLKNQLLLTQQQVLAGKSTLLTANPMQQKAVETAQKAKPKFNKKRKLYKPMDTFFLQNED